MESSREIISERSYSTLISKLKPTTISMQEKNQTSRRGFLGNFASGAAALGLATLSGTLQELQASPGTNPGDPEEVFKNLKGKHRIVFDVPESTGIFHLLWTDVINLTQLH